MAKKQIATFLGPNKGLSIIGGHAAAFSGVVAVTNVAGDLLSFSTGKEYISAEIMFFYSDNSQTDNIKYIVYLNNQIIYSIQLNQATTDPGAQTPLSIILPPLTTLTITGQNITDSDSRDVGATLKGRIYDA